jgi:type VI secretion system protein VasJ
LLERVRQPIRAEAPAGESARDLAEFALVQTEIRKLELPDRPAVDWSQVVSAASLLLGEKSKDLLVAAYLAYALFERDGYAGLAEGLQMLRDLVAGYWDTLYPERARLRGRMGALEWLAERSTLRVERSSPSGGESEAAKACVARLDELSELLASKLEGGVPPFAELRRLLAEAAEASRQPAPAPGPGDGGRAAAAPSAPATVDSAQSLEKALPELKRLMRAVGDYLRRSEHGNPLGYRLPRMAAWMSVQQLPPESEGRTQIPRPQPADLLERLDQLLASGNFAAALEETEGRFPTSVLWLDLQRAAWTALDRQGAAFRPAAEAVLAEARDLLVRFPALPDLRFADGTPLADDATRAWIEERVLAAPAGGGAPAGRADAAAGGEEFEAARTAARELAGQKRLGEAVAILERGATHAGGLPERATWELEIARLCMDAGLLDAAQARLEGFDEALRRSSAEDWEPGLCTEVIRLILQCRQRTSANRNQPEEVERSRVLLSRLCRLDVAAAVEFAGRK